MITNQKIPVTRPYRFNSLLVLSVILLGVSIWLNLRSPRPSAQALNHGESAAFHGNNIPDPLAQPQQEEIRLLTPGITPITINNPNHNQNITISFVYQCDHPCQAIWLSYADSSNHKKSLLIDHFLLHDLNWFSIQAQGLVIYQRQLRVRSLAELIDQKNILTEATLTSLLQLPLSNLRFFDSQANLDGIDYIVTSKPILSDIGYWSRYQQTFNVSKIAANPSGQLIFELTVNQPTHLAFFEVH